MNNCFDVFINNRCLGRGVNKEMANAIISANATLSSVIYKHATLKVVPLYQLNS